MFGMLQRTGQETAMTRTQKERMLAGALYAAADAEIQADQLAASAWMQRYN
ncbi:MAG: maltose acetyltransferase domain-containing protein, partial [Achromobacter mucicolens]